MITNKRWNSFKRIVSVGWLLKGNVVSWSCLQIQFEMYFSLGFLFITVISTAVGQQHEKLKVHVFYESLCGDSRQFITNQLVPSYDGLKDFIDVKLVPHGKSWQIGAGQFACQHGTDECRLNRIQACSLTAIADQPTQIEYVGCQMRYGADRIGQQCTSLVGLNWNWVTFCESSQMGQSLQLMHEQEQNQIVGYPRFVPTITINEHFTQEMQDRLLWNFKGTICEIINHQAPGCW